MSGRDPGGERGGDADRPAERESPQPSVEAAREHLADAPDGCGCTEVWEHMSERRADD